MTTNQIIGISIVVVPFAFVAFILAINFFSNDPNVKTLTCIDVLSLIALTGVVVLWGFAIFAIIFSLS